MKQLTALALMLGSLATAAPLKEPMYQTLTQAEFLKRLQQGPFEQWDGSYTMSVKAIEDGQLVQLEVSFLNNKDRTIIKAPVAEIKFDPEKNKLRITVAKCTFETAMIVGEMFNQDFHFTLPKVKK